MQKSTEQTAIRHKRSVGHSLVEALCMICLLVPLFLCTLDACIFVVALNMNDAVCRNAARAASMGFPNALRKGEPKRNALAAISKSDKGNQYFQLLPEILVSESIRQPLPYPPFGGPINGEVTVVTTAKVFLPVFGTVLRQGPVEMKARKTFAYSFVLPAEAG